MPRNRRKKLNPNSNVFFNPNKGMTLNDKCLCGKLIWHRESMHDILYPGKRYFHALEKRVMSIHVANQFWCQDCGEAKLGGN